MSIPESACPSSISKGDQPLDQRCLLSDCALVLHLLGRMRKHSWHLCMLQLSQMSASTGISAIYVHADRKLQSMLSCCAVMIAGSLKAYACLPQGDSFLTLAQHVLVDEPGQPAANTSTSTCKISCAFAATGAVGSGGQGRELESSGASGSSSLCRV